MSERKQFEKETGANIIHDGQLLYFRQYSYHLESKLSKVREGVDEKMNHWIKAIAHEEKGQKGLKPEYKSISNKRILEYVHKLGVLEDLKQILNGEGK